MIRKLCLIVYSDFFQIPKVVSNENLPEIIVNLHFFITDYALYLPNMGNPKYLALLLCILQLFFERLLLSKLNFRK